MTTERPDQEEDELYRELILDHYRDPRGREPIEEPTASAEGENPLCGDHCRVSVRLVEGHIEAMQVTGRGCAISLASGSLLAELVDGLGVQEAEALTEALRAVLRGVEPPPGVELGDLEALAGVRRFPMRLKCALLPWITLLASLHQEGETVSTEDPEHDLT
jgi:nitrogen fixation NifU-like protein